MPRRTRNYGKAKNFKGAMVRLFKELKSFYAFIIVGLLLAAFGSILSNL